DFSLQPIHVARVKGHVVNPDGRAAMSGNVTLKPDVGRNGFSVSYVGPIDEDGSFETQDVPPGRYRLQARGTDDDTSSFGEQLLVVGDVDINNVNIALTPSARASGTMVFFGQSPLPNLTQVRVAALSMEPFIGSGSAGVDADGQFEIDGVQAGLHVI